jgi:DnaA-homolog protein
VEQLPLRIRLQDRAVFATFHPGGNQLAVAAVTGMVDPMVYLHGPDGSGKSHLLQAFCAAQSGRAYYPLRQLRELGPAVLEGAAELAGVAIDDLDGIAGDAEWERGLFKLYNDCQSAQTPLLISSRVAAAAVAVALPDLRSRLTAMAQFQLSLLTDVQLGEALRLRAAARGLELPDETLQWLQRRQARDMASLCELLDRLDMASLREQRRLTVPFIRQVLGEPV